MKTAEEIKLLIAKEHGWKDWNELPDQLKIKFFDEVVEDIQKQCPKDAAFEMHKLFMLINAINDLGITARWNGEFWNIKSQERNRAIQECIDSLEKMWFDKNDFELSFHKKELEKLKK